MWILERMLLGRKSWEQSPLWKWNEKENDLDYFLCDSSISHHCLFAIIHPFLCHPPVWVVSRGSGYWQGVLAFPRQCPGQPRQAGRGAQADCQIRRPAGCRSWKCSKWIFIPLYQPWNMEGVFQSLISSLMLIGVWNCHFLFIQLMRKSSKLSSFSAEILCSQAAGEEQGNRKRQHKLLEMRSEETRE